MGVAQPLDLILVVVTIEKSLWYKTLIYPSLALKADDQWVAGSRAVPWNVPLTHASDEVRCFQFTALDSADVNP